MKNKGFVTLSDDAKIVGVCRDFHDIAESALPDEDAHGLPCSATLYAHCQGKTVEELASVRWVDEDGIAIHHGEQREPEFACPWCGDGGMDQIGLKYHLSRNGGCDEFADTPSILLY